jgi:hypothetical protein
MQAGPNRKEKNAGSKDILGVVVSRWQTADLGSIRVVVLPRLRFQLIFWLAYAAANIALL